MTDKVREAFEVWWKDQTKVMNEDSPVLEMKWNIWAGFKAGRESMREDVKIILNQYLGIAAARAYEQVEELP